MRDPKRIDKILDELKVLWKKYPDMRLGQLILNVIPETRLYYVEDETLIKDLLKYYDELEK